MKLVRSFRNTLPVLAGLLCLTGAGQLSALVITYQDGTSNALTGTYDGTQDTSLVAGGSVTFNYGGTTSIDMNRSSGDIIRRALLKFDVSSLAGQYSTINSVTLRLTPVGNSVTGAFSAYSVADANAGWIQGDNAGSTADAGESAWNFLASGTPNTNWAGSVGMGTAGTDYNATALYNGTYTASSTAPIDITLPIALLLDWINDPSSNGGVFLRFDTEIASSLAQFRSSEFGTVSSRPALIIDYTPIPEPGIISLTGLAIALTMARRRNRAG